MSTWIQGLSDLFINLSAGWFGAALILPLATPKRSKFRFKTLTINITCGILAYIIGVLLK